MKLSKSQRLFIKAGQALAEENWLRELRNYDKEWYWFDVKARSKAIKNAKRKRKKLIREAVLEAEAEFEEAYRNGWRDGFWDE